MKNEIEEIKIEYSKGWVKVERLIYEGKEAVKLTTNIDDEGELGLTLSYDAIEKADKSFKNLSKQNPDYLQVAILQMLGL